MGISQATTGVSSVTLAGTTTFSPTTTDAFLNVNDIASALGSDNVVVTSGALGTEAGNIAISSDLTTPGNVDHSLTFETGTGVNLVGNINVNGNINPGAGAQLPLAFIATNNLVLNGTLNAGGATIALTASIGSISQTSGTVETSGNLTLQAATGIGASGALATAVADPGVSQFQRAAACR